MSNRQSQSTLDQPSRKTLGPYFPFYYDEFLASPRVAAMSLAAQGLYIRALARQYQLGSLPINPRALSRVLGVDLAELTELWAEVGQCFEDIDGAYVNARMAEVRDERLAYVEKQREHGRKGGRPPGKGSLRGSLRAAEGQPKGSRTSPSPSPSPSPESSNSTGTSQPTGESPRGGEPAWERVIEQLALAGRGFAAPCREWAEYRRESKLRAWSARTWKTQLRKYAEDAPKFAAAVEHSIANGWQGLFPPKETQGGPNGRMTEKQAGLARMREAADRLSQIERANGGFRR